MEKAGSARRKWREAGTRLTQVGGETIRIMKPRLRDDAGKGRDVYQEAGVVVGEHSAIGNRTFCRGLVHSPGKVQMQYPRAPLKGRIRS